MKKLLQSKKPVIAFSIVLAVVLAAGVGLLVWQLTKDDAPEPSTYTINFVTNGGGKIEPMKIEKGTVLSQADLPVPSKRGGMFLTWNTDEALTAPYWSAPIERDITLYASYVEPADDARLGELEESVISYAKTDFSVSVRSSIELTNDTIGNYVVLTVFYGRHENGDAIRLSVTPEGNGIYRISANFAAGGKYEIALVSDAVTFDPNDETLMLYGLTDKLRLLQINIAGEAWMEGDLSDRVTDISAEKVTVEDADSITVTGDSRVLIGATEEENSVICVGDPDDAKSYYKIVGIESTSADGITYKVRPAEIEEIYDKAKGYQWEHVDSDSFELTEEVKQDLIRQLQNNEELHHYVRFLASAATETPTYKALSVQELGEVVPLSADTVITPSGLEFGVKTNVENENFNNYLDEELQNDFVKVTLGQQYEIKLAKLGKLGSVVVAVELKVEFWLFVDAGGYFELGFGSYDIDFSTCVMTQTAVTFNISVQTSDAKKNVNINDEIEAIMNAAKEPAPENILEQYNELMSGGSKPIQLINKEIFRVPIISLLGGLVDISIPIDFVVTLDMEAGFTSYFTILTYDVFGVRGDDDEGLDAFHKQASPRYLYRMELRGHLELRIGIEVGPEIRLGYGLASVSVGAQVGGYAEIFGYFYYEIDGMKPWLGVQTTKGGAYYFELGVYLDIRLNAEICKIRYTGSLWNKKWPFYSAGQKEVVLGFVDTEDDDIVINGARSINVQDYVTFNVYLYDITEERSDTNPKIVENYKLDPNLMQFSFSKGGYYGARGNVSIVTDEMVDEVVMTIKYTGAQMSFRNGISMQVKIKYTSENVDPDKLGKTYRVDFTIDDEVIFTRESSYGQKISSWGIDLPNLIVYKVLGDNKYTIFTNLRYEEQAALYDAGYAYVEWVVPEFVTEDITVEAVHGMGSYLTEEETPSKRDVTYGVKGPRFENYSLTVKHGEIPDLSEYEKDIYAATTDLIFDRWSTEPAPLTEDGVIYEAVYKLKMINVHLEAAGTTDGEAVYEPTTYTAQIPHGGFVKDLFEMAPQIGRKSLVFYYDEAYTEPVVGYPTADEEGATFYARYEDHAYVYFYDQYGRGVLTKRVSLGETVTLTEEETARITYCDPADIERGIRFTYTGLQYGNETFDPSATPVTAYGMSVFATFDREYKVTFLNGDGSVLREAYYPAGTELAGIDLVPTKTPEGGDDHVFLGWIMENGTHVASIAEPMTLKPDYKQALIAYKITFLNHDGSVFDTKYLLYGDDVSSIQGAPSYSDERYHYVFSHWENTDGAESGTVVKGEAAFKPVYTVDSDVLYTVTFQNGDGATTANGQPLELTRKYKYDELEKAIRTYLDEEAIAKAQNGKLYLLDTYTITPASDGICTVALTFTEAMATVTFEAGDGILTEYGQPATVTTVDLAIDQDGFVSLANYAAAPNDASKNFTGWLVGGVSYAKDAKLPAKNGEKLTVTAVYESLLTVTLENGEQTEIRYAEQGEEITLPYVTKESTAQYSYAFAGWRAEDDTVYNGGASYTVTGNVTLTAQFTETVRRYTVTFDANGGSLGGNSTYKALFSYGDMPTADTPARAAAATARYEFIGWSPALSAVTGEATYTAQWREIKRYTVTFNAGEGQFDSSGKNTVTITVDEGHTLTSNDLPMNPYKKTDAGYYEFSAWSPAAAAGTVIDGNVTYTATYESELSARTGITVSDGVNTEDIAAFLNGTSKINGYSYVLDNEFFGKALTVTADGLTLSGEATDLHIVIADTNVTLKDLTLSYTTGIGHFNALGKTAITVSGTVSIRNGKGYDTLRGESSESNAADITLRGADDNSKLIVNSIEYGIAVYGALSIENLDMDLSVLSPEGYDYAIAIQVQNDGALTVTDSDIVVNSGVVNASQLSMTNSDLRFMTETFTPGYTNGLYMMSHDMSALDAIITLNGSEISFTHDIAIAIAVSINDASYYINTTSAAIEIQSTYASYDAFIADVNAKGYGGMVVTDPSSAIK